MISLSIEFQRLQLFVGTQLVKDVFSGSDGTYPTALAIRGASLPYWRVKRGVRWTVWGGSSVVE
jgi:hypothetical protein